VGQSRHTAPPRRSRPRAHRAPHLARRRRRLRRLARALARSLHAASPRGHHHLEGTLRTSGRSGARAPRPHPGGTGHRNRVRTTHQTHDGVPNRTRRRSRRDRIRRHVRPDHRLWPALSAHHRPGAPQIRRSRHPHADESVSQGADGDFPPRGRAPHHIRWRRCRLRRAGHLRGGGPARSGQHGGGRSRLR